MGKTVCSGFRYDVKIQSWTIFLNSDNNISYAYGINDAVVTMGSYNLLNRPENGFYNIGGSGLIDLNVPGAQGTRLMGINDHGDIGGCYWTDFLNMGCFVYHDGKFETLTMPGAQIVRVFGINNAGQIVGLYTKDGGTSYHGFLGTPVRGLSALFLLLND